MEVFKSILIANYEYEYFAAKIAFQNHLIFLKRNDNEASENHKTRLFFKNRMAKIIHSKYIYNIGYFLNKRSSV